MSTTRKDKDTVLSTQEADSALSIEKQRFIRALEEARVRNKYSQRQLCEAIGITIGTLTKYNRGSVDPMRVGVAIMRRLAGEIGVTTNTLMEFIETGEFRSSLSIDDVASWIRSESGQADLPELLAAMSHSTAQLKLVEKSVSVPYRSLPASISYTEKDASVFKDIVRQAFMHHIQISGVSTSRAWSQVKENLVSLGIAGDLISVASEVVLSDTPLTADVMKDSRKNLGDISYDPLCKALKMLEGLEEYEALDRANTLFIEGSSESWFGYSDDEAREWGESLVSAITSLAEKLNKNMIETWFDIEEHLIRMGVSGSECSTMRELVMGEKQMTGRVLTHLRDLFKGRFDEPCPLVIAMRGFAEVKSHKGLLYCSRICKEAERNVPDLIAA